MKQSILPLVPASAIVALTGCATSVPPPPDDLPGETIVYETSPGPWCGRCDTLEITVAADGRIWVERGHWAGDYTNWRETRELLTVTTEKLAAFRSLLDLHRPSGKVMLSDDGCEVFFTHMEERKVTWRTEDREDVLWYNFGCDPQTRANLRDDLEAAPAALGIPAPTYVWVSTTQTR